MYVTYTMYQVDHTKTARQQREDDDRAGELAAEFGRLWHSLTPRRSDGQRRFRPTTGTGRARAECRPSTW
jgi:hypothetical protein